MDVRNDQCRGVLHASECAGLSMRSFQKSVCDVLLQAIWQNADIHKTNFNSWIYLWQTTTSRNNLSLIPEAEIQGWRERGRYRQHQYQEYRYGCGYGLFIAWQNGDARVCNQLFEPV